MPYIVFLCTSQATGSDLYLINVELVPCIVILPADEQVKDMATWGQQAQPQPSGKL